MKNPELERAGLRIKTSLWTLVGAIFVVFTILVTFNWYRDASHVDDWTVKRIQEAKQNGWKLIMENRTFDITLPWSWFKPYTYSLAFVRPDSIREANTVKRAEMLWYRREDNGKIEVFQDFQLFDCSRRKFATLWTHDLKYWKTDPWGRDIDDNYWLKMSKEMRSYFCK